MAKSKTKKSGRPGGRSSAPTAARPAGPRDWIGGARLQTLPLAVAPVVLGASAAWLLPHPDVARWWLLAALCLAVSLLLQIGVNFANDYSDGVRGTDEHRRGPRRLTASGAAKPTTVLTVALVFFGLAGLAGLAVTVITAHWWLLAVGAAAIVAAWFYTGGKRPYGYAGLGELFVFLFFGLVATAGTTFVLGGQVTVESWVGAAAIGLMACAVLMVNNIRDIEQDAVAGKRTLAVRLGARASRVVYAVMLLLPFATLPLFGLLYTPAYLVFFVLLAALPAAVIGLFGTTPPELVLALKLTSLTSLLFAVGLGLAIAL